MKRILALFAVLSLALVLPAGAAAKKGHHSKTKNFKGSFELVGADGSYTDDKFGRAHLQDHRKKDKLHVHVRRLAPRTTYLFALHSVPKGEAVCEPGASGGTQETAFEPKSKQTNAAGNFNSKQRSTKFEADRKRRYFVLVWSTNPDGSADEVVACAALRAKKHKKAASKGKGKGRDKGGNGQENRGQGRDNRGQGRENRGAGRDNRGKGQDNKKRGSENRGKGRKK